MKKLSVIGFFLLVALIIVFNWTKGDDESYNYVYNINNIIKDYDFYKADVSENKISLYDNNFDFISDINFEEYDKKINIISIRKEESRIFYIVGGSVDDEEGYVFINSPENSILNGINYLERIGGNAYYYRTY